MPSIWEPPRTVPLSAVRLEARDLAMPKNSNHAYNKTRADVEAWYDVAKRVDVTRNVSCARGVETPLPRALYARYPDRAKVRDYVSTLPGEVRNDPELLQAHVDAMSTDLSNTSEMRAYMNRLFSDVRAEPYNARLLDAVSCLLQSIAHEDISLGTIPTSREVEYMGAGVSSTIGRGLMLRTHAELVFPQSVPPPFILKAQINNDARDPSALNEALVALYATNGLRHIFPNIMYVYGSFRSSGPRIEFTDGTVRMGSMPVESRPVRGAKVRQVRAFDDSASWTRYNMVETITDSLPLDLWISQNASSPRFAQQISEIVYQVAHTLAVARRVCDFSHNDLHLQNILVTPLGAPATLRYPLPGVGDVFVETSALARIIDLGRSHVRIPVGDDLGGRAFCRRERDGVTYFHTGHISHRSRQSPVAPNSLYDLARFLSSVNVIVKEKTNDPFARAMVDTFLAPLFGALPSDAFLLDWVVNNYSFTPNTIDVDPVEYCMHLLRDVPANMRAPHAINAPTRAPLMQCGDRFPCARVGEIEEHAKDSRAMRPLPIPAIDYASVQRDLDDLARGEEIYESGVFDTREDVTHGYWSMLLSEDTDGTLTLPGQRAIVQRFSNFVKKIYDRGDRPGAPPSRF